MDLFSYALGKKAGGGEEPTGTIQITQNGTYDVKDKASAEVNVPAGANLDDYFVTEISMNTSNSNLQTSTYTINTKKTPPMKLSTSSDIYTLKYCFWSSNVEEFVFDTEHFDTSNLTDISYMFTGCKNLKKLDLSFFDTRKIENFNYICNNCSSLTDVNFSSFTNTRWNATLEGMFYNCKKLAIIDISGFTTPSSSNYKRYCFKDTGINCLQSDGAYADGIPYVYVKNTNIQNDILTNKSQWSTPDSWTTSNVIVKE